MQTDALGRRLRPRRAARVVVSAWACAAACAAVGALGACRFHVDGADIPSLFEVTDGGVSDGAGPSVGDGAMPGVGFQPSNVAPTHVQEGAASLTSPHDIDTEKLLIDGAPPPVGIVFVPEATHDAWAVLSVHDLTVGADLVVHGRRALIVVAVGDIRVSAIVHAEADRRTPGPGGQFTGPGRGGDGKTSSSDHSGGGGAGHGTVGGAGGKSNASTNGEGGLAGVAYTDALLGGSGGGDGANAAICAMGSGLGLGGAGGGAIQLSAKGLIDLVASGGIHAGGGGGRGGCDDDVGSAGGGGGAGGTIWLEAPTMRLLGKVAANGGAGGSGAHFGFINTNTGEDGENGKLDAIGGIGGRSRGGDSGAGGNGGVRGLAPTPGAMQQEAGGGGGAVGVLRLRTRAVAPVTAPDTVLSPAPALTTDF